MSSREVEICKALSRPYAAGPVADKASVCNPRRTLSPGMATTLGHHRSTADAFGRPRTSQSRDAGPTHRSCLGRSQQGCSKRGLCFGFRMGTSNIARHSAAAWPPSSTLSAPPTSQSSGGSARHSCLGRSQQGSSKRAFCLDSGLGRDLPTCSTLARYLGAVEHAQRATDLPVIGRLGSPQLPWAQPTRQRETTLASGIRTDTGRRHVRHSATTRTTSKRSARPRPPGPGDARASPTQLPWAQPARLLATKHRVRLRMADNRRCSNTSTRSARHGQPRPDDARASPTRLPRAQPTMPLSTTPPGSNGWHARRQACRAGPRRPELGIL